jgi:hypothetical protein
VFWVKALPSRAHGVAIIQGFDLDQLCVRSALVRRLLKPHAAPGLGGFSTTHPTTPAALLALKEDPEPRPSNFGTPIHILFLHRS